jgi:uncharacterized protein YraI
MRKALIASIFLMSILLTVANATAQDFGTNWAGIFYNNFTLAEPAAATVNNINGLNFNWASGPPVVNGQVVTGIGNDNFSARFSSTQQFLQGTYTFTVTFDDRVRVRIDGQQVFEEWNSLPEFPKTRTFTATLTAGAHNLSVEYAEETGQALLQFRWQLGGVPGATLAPGVTPGVSTPVPVTALTASISGVRGLAVRSGPYLGASLVTVMTAENGSGLPVSGRNPSEDGVTWYLVTVNGRTGWSSGRFLTFSTDPGGVSVQGSIFDQIDNPPETGVRVATRSNMNLRARPSSRTAILADIPWGAEMPLLGRTVQAGSDRWYQVNYNGQIGWIIAPFTTVRGDVRAVPIR